MKFIGGNAAVIVDRDVTSADAGTNRRWRLRLRGPDLYLRAAGGLVHERVFDSLARDVVELAEKLVLGDPLDHKTDLGPVDATTTRPSESPSGWVRGSGRGGPGAHRR